VIYMANQEVDTNKVKIFILGKEYTVPSSLTIMKAMEYAGYRFVRGSGCRAGFCGACATVYRIKGDHKLRAALACQKTVEAGMYLSQIPFTPAEKANYNLGKLRPSPSILIQYYPEIAKCLSCNTCSKACPQDLDVMGYVQAALRGNLEEVAQLSFDCLSCGLCAIRCPAEIVPYNVALLARRLYGKYLLRLAPDVEQRISEIEEGKFTKEISELMTMKLDDLKMRYSEREVLI
jgi:Fe-S oxidoreductase